MADSIAYLGMGKGLESAQLTHHPASPRSRLTRAKRSLSFAAEPSAHAPKRGASVATGARKKVWSYVTDLAGAAIGLLDPPSPFCFDRQLALWAEPAGPSKNASPASKGSRT